MNLVRCNYGHFFDASVYQQCPHCSGSSMDSFQETRSIPAVQPESNPTVGLDYNPTVSGSTLQQAVQNAAAAPAPVSAPSATPSAVGEDSKTVGFFKKSIGLEPVVGWLVCVEGFHRGNDYRLKSGRNFIGRSTQMDVSITGDETVSRDRHAIVVYEPKNHIFLVQPGDSKELCYLNDEVVLTPRSISSNDILTVGATKLMFFPCCGPVFNWSQSVSDAAE